MERKEKKWNNKTLKGKERDYSGGWKLEKKNLGKNNVKWIGGGQKQMEAWHREGKTGKSGKMRKVINN